MSANLGKSLTIKIKAIGHSFPEMECRAAAVIIDCPGVNTIMGYRFSDAERERLPAEYSRPATRRMTLTGHCRTFPESVDRDGSLLPCQAGPAKPAGRGEWNGVADQRGISPAAMQDAAMMCW